MIKNVTKIDKDRDEEIDNIFKEIKKEDFKFSFCNFIKSIICEDKKNKVYQVASQNLNNYIDIECFILLKQEVSLLKELLLDKRQKMIFDTFSKVINFKNLFKEMKKDVDFKEFNEDEIQSVFESLNFIIKRQNKWDKKIMKFIDLNGLFVFK